VLSQFVIDRLKWRPHAFDAPYVEVADPLIDDDLHLALYCCYELHYLGFGNVDAAWEWEPSLIAFRSVLESCFLAALIADVGDPNSVDFASLGTVADLGSEVEHRLHEIVGSGTGPSLSGFMESEGTLEEFREFAVHRSAYQLKEADPHTWAIPRLSGAAKAALVLIQSDEYGNGDPAAVHAERFAVTMQSLGLDRTYGAYLGLIPGVTLATVNLVSLFGLHRRWRGALVGHLAVFEMASVVPMGRYATALRRLGLGSPAADFYDVHVEADELHQVVAARDLAANFARHEPECAGDVLFGARAIMATEQRFAAALLDAWTAGRTSLRAPLERAAA